MSLRCPEPVGFELLDPEEICVVQLALVTSAGNVSFTGTPVAVLCLNFNISMLESAKQALDLFLSASRVIPQPDALFRDDWQERINSFLHAWLQQRQLGPPFPDAAEEHDRQSRGAEDEP